MKPCPPLHDGNDTQTRIEELTRRNLELTASNQKLLESQKRLERVLEGSDQGFWDWDLVAQKFIISERFESMLGYTLGERDLAPEYWSKYVYPDDLAKAMASIVSHVSGESLCHEVEIRMMTKSGEWRHILTRGRIVSRAADGTPHMMSGTHTDITEQKNLRRKLEEQAHKDFLTRLNNRRYFIEQADLELKRAIRYGKAVSVMLLDIDDFKRINDEHGHQIGDAVLRRLSGVFRRTLRQVDLSGRLGGDEFAILQPETNEEEATKTAERLRQAIQEHLGKKRNTLSISFTVSIGISTNLAGDTLNSLLFRADKALYQAKEEGKNRVCIVNI